MSTFKKLLALTLALAMVLSVSVFAGSYKADTYKDAANIDEDCEEAIELMYALDIMTGDANGNFNPTATITRAEVAKMIYVILNYGEDDLAVNYKGAKFFSDVAAGSWYEGYVNYLATTKLVQGRPDGTFGPNDPVTCAEAAKMLLTAIGYSAEARDYTGANWAQNVLSDAAIIGLLKGYDYNTNAYAPRQWVAVMFQNALEDAYTFDTMRPTFSGLLTSGNANYAYQTMGEKYYGFVVIEGELTGTKYAEVKDGHATESSKYVLIDGELVRGTGLTYMDLGEEFRVIATVYDEEGDTVYYEALSCRNTGNYTAAYAEVQDITYDINYKVSSNDAANKYTFTVDDVTAKTDLAGWLTIGYNKAELNKTGHKNANDLKNLCGEKSADQIKVVVDDDGEIKYIIEVQYTYAMVDDVVESKYYGEYVTLVGADDVALKAGTLTRWYVDEMFAEEVELVEDNFLKLDYDPDNAVYNVEVLPVDEEVTYDERTKEDGEYIYTLGGSDYYVGINGFEYNDMYLKSADFEDLMDVVYDGDLVIYAAACEAYNSLDDVNAMLGLVIATSDTYDNTFWHDRNGIRWMDINGDIHEAEYVNYNDKKNEYSEITFADLAEIVGEDATVASDNTHAQLVIIHQDGKKVWAETIDENCATQLDVTTTTLRNYYEMSNGTLDTEDNTYVVGSGYTKETYKIESENKYFIGIEDEGEIEYKVITIDELAEGYDENTLVQVLTKGTSVKTIRAGFMLIDNLHVDAESSYLYTVSALKEKSMTCDVMFPGAEAAENVEIALAKGVEYNEYTLYEYSYDAMDKVYTLKEVDWSKAAEWVDYEYATNTDHDRYVEIVNLIGDTLVVKKDDVRREVSLTEGSYTGKDVELVLITNIVERKANKDDPAHDDIYGIVDSTIEFVTAEDLADVTIVNGEFEAGVYYYSDVQYDNKDGLVAITVYQTQDEANMTADDVLALEAAKEDAIDSLEATAADWGWSEAQVKIAADAINAVEDTDMTAEDLVQVGILAVRASLAQ